MNGGERLAACKKFVRVQLTQRSKNLSEAFVFEHAAAAVEGVYPPRYPLPGLTRLDTLPRTVSQRARIGGLSRSPPAPPGSISRHRGATGGYGQTSVVDTPDTAPHCPRSVGGYRGRWLDCTPQ